MTPEEVQQQLIADVAVAVEAVNQAFAPLAEKVNTEPQGTAVVALVGVLNAYSNMLSTDLNVEALKTAAHVQHIITTQVLKRG